MKTELKQNNSFDCTINLTAQEALYVIEILINLVRCKHQKSILLMDDGNQKIAIKLIEETNTESIIEIYENDIVDDQLDLPALEEPKIDDPVLDKIAYTLSQKGCTASVQITKQVDENILRIQNNNKSIDVLHKSDGNLLVQDSVSCIVCKDIDEVVDIISMLIWTNNPCKEFCKILKGRLPDRYNVNYYNNGKCHTIFITREGITVATAEMMIYEKCYRVLTPRTKVQDLHPFQTLLTLCDTVQQFVKEEENLCKCMQQIKTDVSIIPCISVYIFTSQKKIKIKNDAYTMEIMFGRASSPYIVDITTKGGHQKKARCDKLEDLYGIIFSCFVTECLHPAVLIWEGLLIDKKVPQDFCTENNISYYWFKEICYFSIDKPMLAVLYSLHKTIAIKLKIASEKLKTNIEIFTQLLEYFKPKMSPISKGGLKNDAAQQHQPTQNISSTGGSAEEAQGKS